jgi:isopenicillin-N epimerase
LHPNIISWGLDVGWHQEFEWTGTRDPTPFLCAPDGIAFMTDFLGIEAMREHNHALAWRAAQMLSERWGLPWATPQSMVGCMVAVPLPPRLGSDRASAERLKDWLLLERGIELTIFAQGGQLWARVAIQVYNEVDDIERFAQAIAERSAMT